MITKLISELKSWVVNIDYIDVYIITTLFWVVLKIICLLVAIAYYTLAERKVMAAIQRRKGPNIVGFWGLLQPLADGLKLFSKEILIPSKSNNILFLFAPIIILTLSLLSWSVIPFGIYDETETIKLSAKFNQAQEILYPSSYKMLYVAALSDLRFALLFILAISSLNVYGIICAGWASNSKYAFLGSLRSAAQMISYEVSMGLSILPVILLSASFNFAEIIESQIKTTWFFLPLLPCVIIFFISMLAETNRAPFDLLEAEAELVAGYNVEYSSIIFAMFFLAEYSNMILMSTILVALFFAGWDAPFSFLAIDFIPFWFCIKIIFVCFLIVLVRATFPRYRYDQLMSIGWKIFLPLSFSYFFFIIGILILFDSLPIFC